MATSRQRLFDVTSPARRRHGRALELRRPGCGLCGGPLVTVTVDEPALFIHGGYGATRRTITAHCVPCRWGRHVQTIDTNPRSRVA